MGTIYTKELSNDQYKFDFYLNTKKKKWQDIKKETGCTVLFPFPYFDMNTYAKTASGMSTDKLAACLASNTMYHGNWIYGPDYEELGLVIDKDGNLSISFYRDAKDLYNYTTGLPGCYKDGLKHYGYKEFGRNGATFVGTKPNGSIVVLISPRDNSNTYGCTTEQACNKLRQLGCTNIVRGDGSWSSQGSLGDDINITPPQTRICPLYITATLRSNTIIIPEGESHLDTSKNGDYTVTTSAGLYYRDQPINGNIMGCYNYKDIVRVVGIYNGWAKASNGYWSSMAWLKKATVESVDPYTASLNHLVSIGEINSPDIWKSTAYASDSNIKALINKFADYTKKYK